MCDLCCDPPCLCISLFRTILYNIGDLLGVLPISPSYQSVHLSLFTVSLSAEGAGAPAKVKRFVRGSKQGNKKMEKLGYTSQVGNVVFNQGAPASIAVGSTKKISSKTEQKSAYTGASNTKRNYMWAKDTVRSAPPPPPPKPRRAHACIWPRWHGWYCVRREGFVAV
jgi:hypothetical protein